MERPFAKDDASHWTHWAAVIREKESGERFAMDSSSGANGENPTVQAAASFYVPDDDGDVTPPEGRAVADANGDGRALAYDDLGALIQRMQALGYADAPTGSTR